MSIFSRTLRAAAVGAVLSASATPTLLCARAAYAQEYNEKTPGYAQAVSAFKAASIIVLGRDLSTKDTQVYSGSGTFGYSGVGSSGYSPIGSFTTNEMVQIFAEYDKQAAVGDKIKDGIDFGQAVKFLKTKLTQDNDASNKMLLILLDKAFDTTYGRVSTPTEQALWMAKIRAKKLWYAPVKLDLLAQFNSDKAEKTATINRAMRFTLGRDATADDMTHWLAQSSDYDHMVLANRTWLYSVGGAAELPAVVIRALQATAPPTKDGSPKPLPSDAQVKETMNKFTISSGNGLVYEEMYLSISAHKYKL